MLLQALRRLASICLKDVSTVVQVKESHDGNACRAVYTVRYADAICVLHVFQKKSRKGIETPKAEIALIEKRLKNLIDGGATAKPGTLRLSTIIEERRHEHQA